MDSCGCQDVPGRRSKKFRAGRAHSKRDEGRWREIPGRPAASSEMRATTSAKVGPRLAAVLRLSARTARLASPSILTTAQGPSARLRAMAARERHVAGSLVARARPFSLAIAGLLAADTWPTKAVLTRCMSAPGWRRILDMIIRAATKVNIHKRFWLSTLVFFRLAGRTNILKGRIAKRRPPRRGFLFSPGQAGPES